MRILEPSAGTGRLIDALDAVPGVDVVAVEISHTLADNLRRRSQTRTDVRCADFLALTPDDLGTFDRIVMNPPFERGSDIKHIEHARGFLKPGGRLVAVCANGPRQREKLQPIAAEWIDLPAGTFAEQGTGVNTAPRGDRRRAGNRAQRAGTHRLGRRLSFRKVAGWDARAGRINYA